MSKFVPIICVMALGLASASLAKEKDGQSATPQPTEQTGAVANRDLTEPVLADAIRLCQLVVADDSIVEAVLETEGWTHEIDRTIGNSPFYKEITAEYSYENVGEAAIWGFVEDYPSNSIGYCSFSISNPAVRFSISAINKMDHMVGQIELSDEQVFGTWSDVSSQPTVFIHAYHNSDTFTYQITRINKLDN